MPVVTIHDSKETFAPLTSTLTDPATGRTTIWTFPLGAVIAASIVLNLLHPPLVICLTIDLGVLFINCWAVYKSGYSSVPWWVYLIIGLQTLQTLRDASYLF